MAERALADHLHDERSRAVRVLLRHPLLDATHEPDGFRLVARHVDWLADWFEQRCGWRLSVDPAAGFARLAKRSSTVGDDRPLQRTRGAGGPFDRRRYRLMCLVCAELVHHPVTTVGLLAGAVTAGAGLDTSRHGERAAFVDALRALIGWGVITTTAGDVDSFLDSEQGNAILTADTARIHGLLVSTTSPSSLLDGTSLDDAVAALLAEPRYGGAPFGAEDVDEDQRLRWSRHSLGRRLLDDPVVHLDDLTDAQRDYLAHPSGRRWLRECVQEAGFELEERAEGVVAVDPDAVATDLVFPAPNGNAHQLALLLIDRLVQQDALGCRRLGVLSAVQLSAEVGAVLDRFPGWARSHRDGDGPARLADAAVDLLVAFGLARRAPDGSVVARPAIARYRAGEPVVTGATMSLFGDS